MVLIEYNLNDNNLKRKKVIKLSSITVVFSQCIIIILAVELSAFFDILAVTYYLHKILIYLKMYNYKPKAIICIELFYI